MLKIFKTYAEREKTAKSEYSMGNFLPYKELLDDNTVYTEDGQLIRVIKVNGFSFETADDEDLDIKKEIRNMLFKGMTSGDVSIYFHIIRKRQKAYPENYTGIDMPDGFATYLDQKWVSKHENNKAFCNELYITVAKKPSMGGAIGGIESLVKKFTSTTDKSASITMIKESLEQLDEAVSRVINSLKEYTPRVLGVIKTPEGIFSEVAEFFAKIINLNESARVRVPSSKISHYIPMHRLYFGNKAIELKKQDGSSKFAGIVSIKEYGPRTWAGMLDVFLQAPFEFVITQSFSFVNRQTAINSMQLQQNRMLQAGDKAITQIAEITEALNQAMGGDVGFGIHHFSIMCVTDNLKELDNILSMANVELTNTGSIAIRETVNMEPAFWGQFPGNHDFIVRKSTVNTLNLASYNSLHNYPVGQATGNHWGDAVTVLDTRSGTPYYFNFHLRDVGHTTIIGPTGSGKTVLMNFLCAQAQKFKCRLFFFDKDRGAEIFIRALNGRYSIIDPSKKCGFNPLLLPDTGENRTFLLEWLKQLVTTNNEGLTSEDISLLTTAIEGNYKLAHADRKLRNIAPFLGLSGPSTLAGRLEMWHSKGSHAKVFDNDEDLIDFSQSSVFGFEMAELLKDKATLGPALLYIFHRISLSLDGTPCMIVLDEAWALIDNPVFAPKIKDWLKVLRKLNTFVVFATQSVEDASKSAISDTLIQQTATQIFLPNLKATEEYRKTFMLSEREFQLIKTTDPGSRFFLIKQGNDAVVARIDLSGMDDIISVLSGRADTVAILDEIRKEHGDDPSVWIPLFYERMQNK